MRESQETRNKIVRFFVEKNYFYTYIVARTRRMVRLT